MTGEFPVQRASNAKNISSSWRHHVDSIYNNEEIIQLIFCAIRAQHAKKNELFSGVHSIRNEDT